MKKSKNLIIIAVIIVVFLISLLFAFKKEARADIIILKNGNLYLISSILGEKQLTTKGNIKLLFDQKNGKIIFGKEWKEETLESERIGGTRLWIMNNDGSNELLIADELVVYAFFDKTGKKIFYNTRNNYDLYLVNIDGISKVNLHTKTLTSNLSPDGNYLVYQKLNPDWQIGQYYDQALGITILDLKTKKEKIISHSSEDFAPIFTPDGKKILFFSRSPEGLASHFIMNTDGSNRKQLTNIGEKFVSDRTIPVISEKPIWSKNGRYLIYESDKEIWINEFDDSLDNIINAKQIAFGLNPQWFIDGKIITVGLTNIDKASESLIKIDLDGKIIK